MAPREYKGVGGEVRNKGREKRILSGVGERPAIGLSAGCQVWDLNMLGGCSCCLSRKRPARWGQRDLFRGRLTVVRW